MTTYDSVPDSAFEYAFEEVPQAKRKSLPNLTVVLAGFPIALSNFVIGGVVAAQLPFLEAILALVVGNIVLMGIVIGVGLVASGRGLASTFLSRDAFGKAGSFIFSMILFASAVIWISTNGDIFARLLDSMFSWWAIPIPVTAAIVVYLWLLSAMLGYRGLAFISKIGVPSAVVLAITAVIFVVNSEGGLTQVFNYVPVESMTFTAATAAVIGGWVYGATITADITRFARKKSHVVIASIIAFSVGCLGFQIAGGLVSISTGESDFVQALIMSGLGVVAFITAIFCLWTTEDKEIYTASLALQNIIKETKYKGRIKHKHTAFAVATVAALFAAGGIFNHLELIIQILSIVIPPIPAIIIIEGLLVKRPKSGTWLNKSALIAWLVGSVLSAVALETNFFISPVIGMVVSGLIYFAAEYYKIRHIADDFSIEQVSVTGAVKNQ